MDMNHHKLYTSIRRGMVFIISFMMVFSLPYVIHQVKATDIIVDDDGTGDYTRIQDAIDNATDGDTIWVKDGSYNEQLNIDKSVKILAVNGAQPIIHATSWVPSINISADNVTISGFKIYGNAGPTAGPTVLVSSGGNDFKLTNNTFKVIAGEVGNITIKVEDNVRGGLFEDNSVDSYDIAIYLDPGSNITINRNVFIHCGNILYHGVHVQGSHDYYGSIQEVIDLVETMGEEESIILVYPGNFSENLLINRSIILRGAQAGNDPTSGRSGDESIIYGDNSTAITINTGASNITIDGFTVTMPNKDSSALRAGIMIKNGTQNIVITNNILRNITDGGGGDTVSDETYGILIDGKNGEGQRDILLSYNLIKNVEEYGIGINGNSSNIEVTNNIITSLIGSDHSPDASWGASWPDDICAAIHLGGEVGPVRDIIIKDNILVTNCSGDGSSGSTAGIGVLLRGLRESSSPNRYWKGFWDIEIAFNRIVNNSYGVLALAGNGSIMLHKEFVSELGNNLSDNSLFGVNNTVWNLSIDATNNWWGDITGPYNTTENPSGLGTNVTGNVTFWPWHEFGDYKGGHSIPPTVDYVVSLPKTSDEYVIKSITEIRIIASDNESGLKSLTYRIWNTTHRWSPWRNYTGPFTLSGQGIHKVEFNATDNSGTSNISTRVHLVDDLPPLVKVLYPNGGEALSGVINITWNAADELFDQGMMKWNGSMSLTADYPGHIQSFIPTEDNMRSVQLLLYGDDATVTVTLFSEIHPVPTPIAQSTMRLQNIGSETSPIWVDFPFDSDVDLIINKTYYIGVTQEVHGDTGFKWFFFNSSGGEDPYKYGHAWIKEVDALVNASNIDWCFKTMYWNTDLDITIQYSNTGISPWSTIAENEANTGVYYWDTASAGIPDGPSYKVRILAVDAIENMGADESDEKFIIDNGGVSVYNIVITDTTIGSTEYTKDGDSIIITATITGDPVSIVADLTGFGKGSAVNASSFSGGTATWIISGIRCVPSNGPVTITITAIDQTGDIGSGTATIIADNIPPEVEIRKPLPGLYIMDSMRLLPFSYPFIIGQITIEAEATDSGSGVKLVEFILENKVRANVTEPPYKWLWDEAATGFFRLSVKAYDGVGHTAVAEISDLFIINFDIIGHRP